MIPVLLITYKRHKYIKEIITILQNSNSKIYIWNNRPPKSYELENDFIQIQKILDEFSSINNIEINQPELHLASNESIMTAIDWFFSINQEGVILEDDCIPAVTFIDYIKFTLPKINLKKNIGVITGTNILSAEENSGEFFLSDISHVWGWATTAVLWKRFRDSEPLDNHVISSALFNKFQKIKDRIYWRAVIELNRKRNLNKVSWDYGWAIFLWSNNIKTIIPRVNLIKNTGNDSLSTNKIIQRKFISNKKIGKFIISNNKVHAGEDFSYKKVVMRLHYLSNWPFNILRFLRAKLHA